MKLMQAVFIDIGANGFQYLDRKSGETEILHLILLVVSLASRILCNKTNINWMIQH